MGELYGSANKPKSIILCAQSSEASRSLLMTMVVPGQQSVVTKEAGGGGGSRDGFELPENREID